MNILALSLTFEDKIIFVSLENHPRRLWSFSGAIVYLHNHAPSDYVNPTDIESYHHYKQKRTISGGERETRLTTVCLDFFHKEWE